MSSSLTSSEEEYISQFHGHTCNSALLGVKIVLHEVFEDIMDRMETKISNRNKYDIEAVRKVKNSVLASYKDSIEDHNDELNEILQRYFVIAKDVILPEDEIQGTEYTSEDEEELKNQIKAYKNRFSALKMFEEKLEETVISIIQFKKVSQRTNDIFKKVQELEGNIEKSWNLKKELDSLPLDSITVEFIRKLTMLKL